MRYQRRRRLRAPVGGGCPACLTQSAALRRPPGAAENDDSGGKRTRGRALKHSAAPHRVRCAFVPVGERLGSQLSSIPLTERGPETGPGAVAGPPQRTAMRRRACCVLEWSAEDARRRPRPFVFRASSILVLNLHLEQELTPKLRQMFIIRFSGASPGRRADTGPSSGEDRP